MALTYRATDDHAHAKAFEGNDYVPTVSITIRRCTPFIGSSGSNTIAVHMPLVGGLRPFRKNHDIVEHYGNHFDLVTGATGFNLAGLGLERRGLKVFDFHTNIVFINAASDADYRTTKDFYHEYERLLAARRPGKGARTLLLELLEAVHRNDLDTATVGDVNAHRRTVAKWT